MRSSLPNEIQKTSGICVSSRSQSEDAALVAHPPRSQFILRDVPQADSAFSAPVLVSSDTYSLAQSRPLRSPNGTRLEILSPSSTCALTGDIAHALKCAKENSVLARVLSGGKNTLSGLTSSPPGTTHVTPKASQVTDGQHVQRATASHDSTTTTSESSAVTSGAVKSMGCNQSPSLCLVHLLYSLHR